MTPGMTPTRNIILFGETGAGKSSIINLMAGQQIAHISPDSYRCTMDWTEYPITFEDGTRYNMFDTIGLEEPRLQTADYLTAISNAYGLINTLKERARGVDLLLFCIRGGRVTSTMQSNYRLFFEFLCEEKVPLVLVVTNLERESRMEDWYTRNVGHLEEHNIRSAGHACITAANLLDGRHRDKYEESRGILRRVVEAHCNASMEGWTGGEGWFSPFVSLSKLVEFVVRRPKKTDAIGYAIMIFVMVLYFMIFVYSAQACKFESNPLKNGGDLNFLAVEAHVITIIRPLSLAGLVIRAVVGQVVERPLGSQVVHQGWSYAYRAI
ncbi:P-loop containing nucleoside triphosphate hydrolase protein [Suillus subalutaceus]|uniref:P-loop containing nucleoside triphosphate hydrolase protein n=1 Tax=Suillus subalutaceus TaxID=48586 RepID=UPI001B85D10F|nr:P-loop containing nucleoside triphosphate hydrolase protein [Suillus subalutaceus]KAG1856375.1 P-loop containing nucleoside triphosphate hydrolase protein [Suillus subalutaceus]